MKMKILILIILASFGCSTTNKTTTNSKTLNSGDLPTIRKMTIKKSYKKTDERIAFKIKGIKQLDNTIAVDVQFSGCGKDHDFELISNGKVGNDGVVNLYLVDNTKGDYCKMLLMRTKHFDVSKYNKKSIVTGFKINDGELISFKRTK